jgi:hypothetical protein
MVMISILIEIVQSEFIILKQLNLFIFTTKYETCAQVVLLVRIHLAKNVVNDKWYMEKTWRMETLKL